MINRGNKYILIFLFAIASNVASAQKFTLTVDKSMVYVGEQFEATYSINSNGDDFQAPAFNNVRILSGPNVSTNFSMINGSVSRSESYSFILMAIKPGNVLIPPATISMNGHMVRSNALVIKVVAGGQQPLTGNSKSSSGGNSDAFIALQTNKSSAYVGEAVEVNYKLYVRNLRVNQNTLLDLPSFNGFWAEDERLSNNLTMQPETVNGKEYEAVVLKHTILFPQKPGKLVIDNLSATIEGEKGGENDDNFIDNFFRNFSGRNFFSGGGEPFSKTLVSNKFSIDVKPLPADGKPKDFSGFVGDAELIASVDKNQVKAGEPFTLKLRVNGQGNMKLLQAPVLKQPKEFEAYEPVSSETTVIGHGTVYGSKSFAYTLVPKEEGNFDLAIPKISFFNPSDGNYHQTSAGSIHVAVHGEAIKSDRQDRFISTNQPNRSPSPAVWVMGAALVAALSLLAFVIIRRRKKDDIQSEIKFPVVTPDDYLNKAVQAFENGLYRNACSEILNAIYMWLKNNYNVTLSEIPPEEANIYLTSKGLSESTADEVGYLINECTFNAYAPQKGEVEVKELLRKAKNLIG